MTTPLKDQVLVYCQEALDKVKNPDRKSNEGKMLFEIFVWQELSKVADEGLKDAWKKAEAEGILKPDDTYRAKGAGEHLITESEHFSVLMTVKEGAERHDKDMLLTALVKKTKLPLNTLTTLYDTARKKSKNSLSKRILEV